MKNLLTLTLTAMVIISSPAKAEELWIRNQIVLNVEVAHNDVERARGLMNRKSLAEDAGMLFLFPDARIPAFWMKDTLIPLDMVFIGPDSRIQEIHENAKPNDLTPISPQKPVRAVLEIGGGMAEKLGLEEGDEVSSSTLAKSLELP